MSKDIWKGIVIAAAGGILSSLLAPIVKDKLARMRQQTAGGSGAKVKQWVNP